MLTMVFLAIRLALNVLTCLDDVAIASKMDMITEPLLRKYSYILSILKFRIRLASTD